jgi:hypothetical protein
MEINQYPLESLAFQDDDYYDIDFWTGSGYQTKKILGSVIKAGILSAVENIYNTDGTLDANRIVDLNGNTLRFSNGIVEFDQGSANSAEIKLYEDSDFGGNYVSIRSPQTLTTDRNFFLPGNQPTDGYFLKTTGGFGSTQWGALPMEIQVAASDETTPLTLGNGKVTFRMPHRMTLTQVRASLTTPQQSGAIIRIDIIQNGVSVLSTKCTIDNTERTSTSAATLPVIVIGTLADDSEMRVDITQIGDGTAKGLKVTLIGTRQ